NSWCGPARPRARRSTAPCSKPRARRSSRTFSAQPLCRQAIQRIHPPPRMMTGGSMAVATSTAQGARTLGDFSGTIVLVGAGKMGGAMLESWLSLGLAARTVVVIEPQPTGELAGLAGPVLRL